MASMMAEIVYGTKEEGHVMSEKVTQLASSVYSEFEKMIKKYDEDVVKELMPLVVGILESLDLAYTEKQEADVEIELLKEDNEQLLTQYEREKQLRKSADQKYLEMEDENQEVKKQTEEKVESLESIVRMLELKNKNASDHLTRMEDKESELKKEYNKVHERYTELMRTHMDYMERAKMLMGTDRIAEMANSPRASIDRGSRKGSYSGFFYPRSSQSSPFELGMFNLPSLKQVGGVNLTGSVHLNSTGSPPDASAFDMMSSHSGKDSNVSIKSELGNLESPDIHAINGRQVVLSTETTDREQNTDRVDVREFATATKTEESKKDLSTSDPAQTSQVQSSQSNSPPETPLKADTEKAVSYVQTKIDTQLAGEVQDRAQAVLTQEDASSYQSKVGSGDATISVENVVKDTDNVESSFTKNFDISVDIETGKENFTQTQGTEHNKVTLVKGDMAETQKVKGKTRSVDISTPKMVKVTSKKSSVSVRPQKKSLEVKSQAASSPQEPMSPVFDENDFSYEEDSIPGLDETIAHIVATTPELDDMEGSMDSTGTNKPRKHNNTSIYDELTIQDADLIGDVDFGADITGRAVNPADYASSDSDEEKEERNSTVSDNFFGMSRELENLILENTELLATKNALNIVKDDLIAKVDELSSEQEILREEISSLKAVKDKLQGRIKELEEELKKTREELEAKAQQQQEAENEDDVPMAQRKRFTRVEMARVLMERNQYKERLMELQEAVRWTEMIRASREHPEISSSKKKSSIWNFFSNLFSSPNKPQKKPLPIAMVKYNAPTTNLQPVGDPNQKNRGKYQLGDKNKAYDFLQDDLNKSLGEPIVTQPDTSERAKKEREKERKEQYKQVRAHVKKDDGRMQAYGWSLPAKFTPQIPSASSRSTVPVPVPVYCRPLLENEQGIKIWCAAGVNLTGGRTRDGGCIVGASVFYSTPSDDTIAKPTEQDASEIGRLDRELKDHEKNMQQMDREQLSSLVWICTSTNTQSCVSVIDADHPGDVLETFRVSTTPVLCIASVAGALESDYPVDEDILRADAYPQYPEAPPPSAEGAHEGAGEEPGIGGISLVQCATGSTMGQRSGQHTPSATPPGSRDASPSRPDISAAVTEALAKQKEEQSWLPRERSGSPFDKGSPMGSSTSINKRASLESIIGKRASQGSIHSLGDTPQATVFKAKGEPVNSGAATPDLSRKTSRRLFQEPSGLVKDGINSLASGNDLQTEEVEKMGSVLPTMWMGTQSGSLYVHSSVAQWKKCLHSVKLRDSVLNIVHVKGRVLVALADGTVAIFHRHTDGHWDVENYHLLDLGRPHHSIRCMAVIANKHVWCGYRNKIHVVDPQSMSIVKSFDAHPRKESQVRQLAWVGDGVWVSIRLDSTLRLYHAYTHQHLQDVDIEPYVSKMLGTGKLGFSFVRITSMLISCNRLWIGTGNGVIISVPLSENNKQAVSLGSSVGRPGGLVRVYSDTKTDNVTPASFIPYCTMAQAQLSFHGHRDAVKFFVAVPGKKHKSLSSASFNVDNQETEITDRLSDDGSRLVLSGGEGYVDFRIVFNLQVPKARKIFGFGKRGFRRDGDDDIVMEETGEDREEKTSLSKGERSHLIVWEVSSPE